MSEMNASDAAQLMLQTDCDHKYFNGFGVALTIGDVMVSLSHNNKQFLLLNTSYTVAKSLAKALNDTIDQLENKTSNKIMTVEEIHQKLIGG